MDGQDEAPATAFRDVVVVGGGCYGTFYGRQLEAAADRGKVTFRQVVLVDRDPYCQAVRELTPRADRAIVVARWDDYLDALLAREAPHAGQPDDAIVPSPLMPHLMAHWLEREARRRFAERDVRSRPAREPVGTPYDVLAPDGTRYVSFADWLCPTHCVEPHVCPVIRGPRTWEMSEAIERHVERLGRRERVLGPALFVTRHRAFGVGMFDVAEARRALDLVVEAGRAGGAAAVVIGTISSCHGALTILELGPAAGAYSG